MADPAPDVSDTLAAASQALWTRFLAAVGGPIHSELAQAPDFGLNAAALAPLQSAACRQHAALLESVLARPGVAAEPADRAAPGDRRSSSAPFSSEEWRRDAWSDYVRQAYLINAHFLSACIEALDIESRAKDRLRFAASQWIGAMSPANFLAANPEAIRLALDTGGESLSRGIRNLVGDLHKGRISTSDEQAFEVGRNLAITEGAVVFENDVMQLIQYAPRTATVHRRALLMVPPCINKYYILDLQPESSFVRYAAEQGHVVFMISWRNPGSAQAGLTWDDYLDRGVLQAMAVVREISREPALNCLGFCVGGTMLGAALAVQSARGETAVASATFLAAMLDFSAPGDIGLFVDEASVAAREAAIGRGGILPGSDLALVFSALRAKDLVWPYVINNYLKGRPPQAFDVLYWNADATNLPGPMYCSYVRSMYLENALCEPGRLRMLGVPVDLGRIAAPAYVFAAREDHIVPWRTAYRTTRLLAGEIGFTLGASGHIAGVVNPPARGRRSFWTGAAGADPDAWLRSATEQSGSWWPHWSAWLSRFGGGKVKRRSSLGSRKHRVIEPAPGRYVRQRA